MNALFNWSTLSVDLKTKTSTPPLSGHWLIECYLFATATARQLIDMPAREEFQNFIAHLLDEYRVKYPNNKKVPQNLKDEVEWLKDEGAE